MEGKAQLKGGKFMSLREAVSLIKDGDQITLGGFTTNRNPMALCREIIRQKRRTSTLQCTLTARAWNL